MKHGFSFLPFLLCLIVVPSAQAGQQTARYDVYASGLKVVTAELVVDMSVNHYALALSAETKGFLAKMAPWKGRFDTKGWVLKNRTQPELHRSSAIWRGDEEIKEYSYARDGAFKKLTITEDGKKPVSEFPPSELTKGTTDALTAALSVLETVARGGACEGTADVFDGKRRFTQTFKPQGREVLKRSRYNIFEGEAARCTVEVVPAGGEWHKKPRGWMSIQEQGRTRGTMPTLWAARMSENDPAIPVKIMVKTAYGTLFMHLVEYKNGA